MFLLTHIVMLHLRDRRSYLRSNIWRVVSLSQLPWFFPLRACIQFICIGCAARSLWPPVSLIFTSGDGAANMRPMGESLHDGDDGHVQAYRTSRYGEQVPSSARLVRPWCVDNQVVSKSGHISTLAS